VLVVRRGPRHAPARCKRQATQAIYRTRVY
jgi:hypothetical protein